MQNIVTGGTKGKTLMEAINSIDRPVEPTDKPLRALVKDACNISKVGTVVVGGGVSGTMKSVTADKFAPAGIEGPVGSIQHHHENVEHCSNWLSR